jgi:hypothetical protein
VIAEFGQAHITQLRKAEERNWTVNRDVLGYDLCAVETHQRGTMRVTLPPNIAHGADVECIQQRPRRFQPTSGIMVAEFGAD